MRIIFLGAPGSGKGTQGDKLASHFGYQLLTASSLLRSTLQSGSSLSKQIQADMDAGKLVSDQLVWEIMSKKLVQCQHADQSVVLDGFPRSLGQLAYLQQDSHHYDHLFYFEVSDAVVMKRICGRRVHLPSGRVYHVDYAPPKVDGMDDVTGEPLTHRPDDTPEVVAQRLATYHAKTLPILDVVREDIAANRGAIRSLITLNADQPIDQVSIELAAHLGVATSS